eukprot:SM000724S21268  [mRNA]  locus=s724:1393:1863:- [translate_table: standard]
MRWRHPTRASMASGARTVASLSTGGTPPKTAPTPVAATGRGDGPAAASTARTHPPVAWAGTSRTTTAKPCSLDPTDLLTWRTHCTQGLQLQNTRLLDLCHPMCELAEGGNSCGHSKQQLNTLNTMINWTSVDLALHILSVETCKYGGLHANMEVHKV